MLVVKPEQIGPLSGGEVLGKGGGADLVLSDPSLDSLSRGFRGCGGNDLRKAAPLADENPMHEVLIALLLWMFDERMLPAGDRHQSAIDTRSRAERRGGDSADESEFEPWPPLCRHHRRTADSGAAACDLPLNEQDGIGPSG